GRAGTEARSKRAPAKNKENTRPAYAAGGPHGVGPSAARPAELERKLARAQRERRQHGDGDGGAERHGEGRCHSRTEQSLRYREDEHEDRSGAGPDADREHHRRDLPPRG